VNRGFSLADLRGPNLSGAAASTGAASVAAPGEACDWLAQVRGFAFGY
jgi:hypothetical protein